MVKSSPSSKMADRRAGADVPVMPDRTFIGARNAGAESASKLIIK